MTSDSERTAMEMPMAMHYCIESLQLVSGNAGMGQFRFLAVVVTTTMM